MSGPAPPRWVYAQDLAPVLTNGDDAGNGVPAFLTLSEHTGGVLNPVDDVRHKEDDRP